MQKDSEGKDQSQTWIPEKVLDTLSITLNKEPIDLDSPDVVGKHFASQVEIEDVREIISQVGVPLLVGLNGSRATLERSPLFASIDAFEEYYRVKSRSSGGLQNFLKRNGLSERDYVNARTLLQNGMFNERYTEGERFDAPIVELLVSDIDLLIITGSRHMNAGYQLGERSNIFIDLSIHSPFEIFDSDPEDLERYLTLGLKPAIPLKW